MEIKNCVKCNLPWKLVPAGTSRKTGKPYPSFYACDACKHTMNVEQKPAQNDNLVRIEAKLDKILDILETSDIQPKEPTPF